MAPGRRPVKTARGSYSKSRPRFVVSPTNTWSEVWEVAPHTPPTSTTTHSPGVMSTATSAPASAGATPPSVNPNSSVVRAAAPQLHVTPVEPNHCGLPAPIAVGPRLMSACHAGATSTLTTPTSAPSARPADNPTSWDPVGSVTLGTTPTAVVVVRSPRHLRALPRSPTPLPFPVRPSAV